MVLHYKPDEGRNARQASFWMGSIMTGYGCYALRGFLNGWVSLRNPILPEMERLPVVGVEFNGSLVIALLAFAGLMTAWLRFLGRPKVADHLIEVENEMRKVTWPSFKEASNSSLVVIATVLILMAFLALSDWALAMVFNQILFRGGA